MPAYEKNLALLEEKNPLLSFQLLTSNGEESREQVKSFPASEAEVLYVVGLGDSAWTQEALKWVEREGKRRLALLEENLSIFRDFLSLEIAEKVVSHPRITLSGPPFEETLRSFVWSNAYKSWESFGDTSNRKKLEELILGVELTVCLYRDYGIPQLMNVFSNLNTSEKVRSGEGLFGKFSKVPAIICGAGPSLEDHVNTLKRLENQALIFGGGSALPFLTQENVPIHFGVALDPEPPGERFYAQTQFEVPLFYQNQVSHLLLQQSHGPKLCLGESQSFPLEEWLELSLSPCDVGWNVSTFATQIAFQLGCDPIIFVGMDLCVSDGNAYAGAMSEERDNPIEVKDRFGNSAVTRPDFLMAKKWLEAFATKHRETTFLNATTRGLTLEGIENVPLNIKSAPKDLKGAIFQAIEKAPLVDLSQVTSKLQKLYQSVCNCQEVLGSYRDVELDGEIFYQAHLLPNWEIWKHFLQKEEIVAEMQHPEIEKKLQQTLFFREITEIFRNQYERNISI